MFRLKNLITTGCVLALSISLASCGANRLSPPPQATTEAPSNKTINVALGPKGTLVSDGQDIAILSTTAGRDLSVESHYKHKRGCQLTYLKLIPPEGVASAPSPDKITLQGDDTICAVMKNKDPAKVTFPASGIYTMQLRIDRARVVVTAGTLTVTLVG